MYVEASRKKKGEKAKLEINPGFTSGKTCMTFFYHMRGGYGQMGRLRVLINGKQVFEKSGNQGNSWLEEKITYDGRVSSVRTLQCCYLNLCVTQVCVLLVLVRIIPIRNSRQLFNKLTF